MRAMSVLERYHGMYKGPMQIVLSLSLFSLEADVKERRFDRRHRRRVCRVVQH